VLNDEIALLVARLFDCPGSPTHDELGRFFTRCDLVTADPAGGGAVVGKMKRVRAVLGYAIDDAPQDGSRLVKMLIDAARARGAFRPDAESYAGADLVGHLRRALRSTGYDLDAQGHVRPRVLESLEGSELTEALWSYVRRARSGADDAELLIGSAKNLEEAAARHVLKTTTGDYPIGGREGSFPTTLYQAFDRLGLAGSTCQLDADPYRAMQQAIFLLGCAVNRLRNQRGDGHGRPEMSVASQLEGRMSSEAAALVTELLLTALQSGESDSAPAS
jgi:hypothetical protein